MSDEADKSMIAVHVQLALAVRGPIPPLGFNVDGVLIRPSYPRTIQHFGSETPFPFQLATMFEITWNEAANKQTNEWVRHKREPTWRPILHKAINSVNRLLWAFKYECINHLFGLHVRTVGEGDVVLYSPKLNGLHLPSNTSAVFIRFLCDDYRTIERVTDDGPEQLTVVTADDVFWGAAKRFNSGIPPVGGRLLRCVELTEHGYYSESVIVAHATIDDVIQRNLRKHLENRGLNGSDAKGLLRSIKDNRWKTYFGPLLKAICGKSLVEIWPDGVKAAKDVNDWRNDVAHAGTETDVKTAYLCTYFAARCISELHQANILEESVEPEVLNYIALLANWVNQPPAWVSPSTHCLPPSGNAQESPSAPLAEDHPTPP